MSIREEKLSQICDILKELGIDMWMIVEKESGVLADPVSDYLIGAGATWLSFFIFTKDGKRNAIVGNLDEEKFSRLGIFDKISTYKNTPKDDLIQILEENNPNKIALNYSVNSPAADGLSYGRFLQIQAVLRGTVFIDRIVTAEEIIAKLRGRKSLEEIKRIKEAINITLDLFKKVTQNTKPGLSEKEVAAIIQTERMRLALEPSWEADHNPSVFTGPQITGAHSGPTDKKLQRGHVFNIDTGVKCEGYCSDLQRTWYILRGNEDVPPNEVIRGFETIKKSVQLAFEALKPGVKGFDIDKIARDYILSRGYKEFPHALGHQVGRDAHDGGALLGPDWERYGNLPFLPLEKDQVFTIEPRLYLDDFGVVTIEEMVQITEFGAIWLSKPQEHIYLIK